MSALIANKVKANMCLVSIKLFIVRTIFCATYTKIREPVCDLIFLCIMCTFVAFAFVIYHFYAHTDVFVALLITTYVLV